MSDCWMFYAIPTAMVIFMIKKTRFWTKRGLDYLVERQNEKRGLESGFGSAGYIKDI